MRFLFFFFLSFLEIASLHGQENDLAIGQWKSHLPQRLGRKITQSSDKIIYANKWNIISIDKEDLSAEFLTKVDGLSDIGIEEIEYDHINDQLIIVYNNSNIDIVKPNGTIINIPNIKNNTNISGDKRIKDILITERGNIFFATGFGTVQLFGDNFIFGATTITNAVVNTLTEYDGMLYAGLNDGLYRVNLLDDINFSDFNQWEIVEDSSNVLPPLPEVKSLISLDSELYVATSNQVFKTSDGETFYLFFEEPDEEFQLQKLSHSEDKIIAAFQDPQFDSKVYLFDKEGNFDSQGPNCANRVTDVIIDEQGRVWYADEFVEIRYSESIGDRCERLTYNSPFDHSVSDIEVKNGVVLACDGGVSDNFQYLFSRNGFYIKDGISWSNFNEYNNEEIRNNDLLSFFRIKAHPTEEKIYVGSYWGGLLEFNRDNKMFKVFNQDNSSIMGAIGDEARERISGIAIDIDNNLWVTAYGASRPLNVMTPEGEWMNYSVNSPKELSNITIDPYGYKWIPISGNNGGVLVYDSGESITNISDDRQRYFTATNSELPTNKVNVVSIDREGVVWVGTSEGPVIFNCGSDVFDEECRGVRRKVLEDSIAAFLLADQNVLAIAADGADRKWFGTQNGVFVQSPDGEQAIVRFSEDNSPLFDNLIHDMAYDGISGEMYIGTDKGIISYKTSTTTGTNRHRASDILVYPNPVHPGYDGPIAIKGLVEGAEVKITDVNGNLVFLTEALGGQAIWNGIDLDGSKVSSGVYLIFSSDSSSFSDGDAFVTKVLILR